MNKIIQPLRFFIFTLMLAAGAGRADTTNIQTVPFHVQSVTSAGCPGSYTGYAYMTNHAGTMWLTPPTNSTSATFIDLSGYTSAACVTKYPVFKYCDTNSVAFPVTSTASYELYIFVKNGSPTNGQPMTVQVVWH